MKINDLISYGSSIPLRTTQSRAETASTFKDILDEACGKLSNEDYGLFLSDVEMILENGVQYPLEFPSAEEADVAAKARIARLGFAGSIEFALQTQARHVRQNKFCGNEQRFLDKMQQTVDVLSEIMERLRAFNDPAIERQIMLADGEYGLGAAKDDRDGIRLAAELATGMSEEEFQAVMHGVQTQVRRMPDGSLLLIQSKDGRVVSQVRRKPRALSLM